MDVDLIEATGAVMRPWCFQYDPASCHPAATSFQRGHVLLDRSMDGLVCDHPLKIDLKRRLHDFILPQQILLDVSET
jgi:hypothetical protein